MQSDSGVGDIPLEVAFDALAHHRRRLAIAVLQRHEPPVSLEGLARQMQVQLDMPGSTRVEELKIELHHQHLPKLMEPGILEYDPARRSVTRVDLPDPTGVRGRIPSESSQASPDECISVPLEGEHR